MSERGGVAIGSGTSRGIEQDLSRKNSVCLDLYRVWQVVGSLLVWCLKMWSTYTFVVNNLDDGSEVTGVATVGQEDYTTDFDESEFPQKQPLVSSYLTSKFLPIHQTSPSFRKTSRISTYRHCEVCT